MAMPKIPITITYRHAGTQPPIFVAGEFSDPPWAPQEMDFTTDEDGEHTFNKEVLASAGSKVQYKFRVGLGDWWVLDENGPTALDSAGFLNNVAEVPSSAEMSSPSDIPKPMNSKPSNNTDDIPVQDASITGVEDAQKQSEPHLPTSNAAKEVLNQPSSQRASTPVIAEAAAEVADSAAMLDKDAVVPSHTDASIGGPPRGFLNLTEPPSNSGIGTPVFAKTADEVADTAAWLDKDVPISAHTEPSVANAARELMNRNGTHVDSGTSTPSFVKTAAEVADSAALLDKDDEWQSDTEPPVANAAKELMNRGEHAHSGSGASTPSFVKIAAEVADSAALLDKEEPEGVVTDEEAGRTGYRRMSTTPIPEVAITAAEVADTAQKLDEELIPEFEFRPTEYDDVDPYGLNEPLVSDNKAPLFAHECVGMEVSEDNQIFGAHEDHSDDPYDEGSPSPGHGSQYDADNIDPDDPTLERFPSNREEIIDVVRKLEGGMNEDQSDVEGLVPPSPVVGPSGPQNHDLLSADFLVSSPVVTSPVTGRGSRSLGFPGRSSLGSISSDRLSAASLGSISEAEEEVTDEEEEALLSITMTPKPDKMPSTGDVKYPASDDDEGVVLKMDSGKPRGGSPVDSEPRAATSDHPSTEAVSENQFEDGPDTPSSAAKDTSKFADESDKSGTQTPVPGASENPAQQLPFLRTGHAAQRVNANAWAAAVREKDAAINKELLAHRQAQEQELQAQGLEPEDVQAPIKDTWRPTTLDTDGRRKNEKTQKANYGTKTPEPPVLPIERESGDNIDEGVSRSIDVAPQEESGESSGSQESSTGGDAPTQAAQATGVDTSTQSQLTKRTAGPDRTGTPVSIHSMGIQAAKSGNWFQSFFRMIFVDWVGGFISKLFGGKRET